MVAPLYPQPGGQTPFNQPGQPPIPGMTDDQDDDRAPSPQRGPVFNTFPPPQVVTPQPGNAYPMATPGVVPQPQVPLMLPQPNGAHPNGAPQMAPYPGAPTVPGGVASPGMMPPQPGQQPKRPGPGN